MRLKTFFENFDLLADAPNGVQKLRELILHLAVQGKLVPQDTNDEPASMLLEKIKLEKEWLTKEGKIRKEELLPPIEQNEVLYDLPDIWRLVRIGDVLNVIRGASPRPKGDTRYFSTKKTPYHWIKISDIRKYSNGNILTNTEEFLTKEGAEKSVLLERGTLLLTNSATIGIPIVLGIDGGCIHDGYLAFPYLNEIFINTKYLYYYFLHFQSALKKRAFGGAQLNLNTSIVKNALFPLPPAPEQKRIVAKVDELMALCDKLEARQQKRREGCVRLNNAAIDQLLTTREPDDFSKHWQRISDNFDLLYSAPENIGKLRQAILQLAIQGKLVPQDPNDEPASMLLEKIKDEKERLTKEKKIKKLAPLPPIEIDEVLFNLPNFWRWIRLGQVVKSVRYGTSKNCSYEQNGVPVLRIPNLVNGSIEKEDLKFTTLPNREFQELRLVKDDLLMIRSNGSKSLVGRTAVVSSDVDGYAYAGYLVRLRVFLELVDTKYLHLAINTHFVREQIEIPIRTTSGVKNINSTEIINLLLPLPPYKEQKRIVAKVNKLMALCDELEAKLTQSQTDSDKLINATVRQVLGM